MLPSLPLLNNLGDVQLLNIGTMIMYKSTSIVIERPIVSMKFINITNTTDYVYQYIRMLDSNKDVIVYKDIFDYKFHSVREGSILEILEELYTSTDNNSLLKFIKSIETYLIDLSNKQNIHYNDDIDICISTTNDIRVTLDTKLTKILHINDTRYIYTNKTIDELRMIKEYEYINKFIKSIIDSYPLLIDKHELIKYEFLIN